MGHDIEILIDCAIINTQAYLSAPGGDRRVARVGLDRVLRRLDGARA